MDASFMTLRDKLQTVLDEISSPRSSIEDRTKALEGLESLLGHAFLSEDNTYDLDHFMALQFTFECNVPSRLISWINISTSTLDSLTIKGLDDEREPEAQMLSKQLALSLSIIQGIVLSHPSSKVYMGRKYALEVLLALLLASRHLPPTPPATPVPTLNGKPTTSIPLTSVVLDTLLCILVDSSDALRVFESASGVQAIVKILKRAGTPREVRMKCLEFLYFYLLDETIPSSDPSPIVPTPNRDLHFNSPPTAPATPFRQGKPSVNGTTPMHPSSRYGSSTYSFPSTGSSSVSSSGSSLGSSSSSRSTSGSSTHSFSSTSSNASSITTSSTRSSSPDKPSAARQPYTPPESPQVKVPQLQIRSLMMLKKDVDYVPQSPKKMQFSKIGVGSTPGHTRAKSISSSRIKLGVSGSDDDKYSSQTLPPERSDQYERLKLSPRSDQRKTTQEKKELLGTMLGNVDALVEGVRKAGIWGLG